MSNITIAEFPHSTSGGGTAIYQPWAYFADRLTRHDMTEHDTDEGKDGSNYVFADLRKSTGKARRAAGGDRRRTIASVISRTALAFDVETNKETGEVPPAFNEMEARIRAKGLTGVIYTSFKHTPELPRYRIVLPITHPIGPLLPAVEVMAEQLGILGVLDIGKLGAQSVFFHPRAPKARWEHRRAVAIEGAWVDADLLVQQATELQAKFDAEKAEIARQRAEAKEKRRADLEARGIDPDWSIIAKIRAALLLDGIDLHTVLTRGPHNYAMNEKGDYRHRASESGSYGLRIFVGDDGVERAFSLNTGDPLHERKLKAKGFDTSKAADVVDVLAVLEFDGIHKKALRELAARYKIESAPGEWHIKLNSGETGTPKPILFNVMVAFRCAPEWQGRLGYNEFADQVMLLDAPPWGGDGYPREIDNVDATRAAEWLQGHGIAVSSGLALEAMVAVAHEAKFHPVRDYLDGLKWDGTARIDGVLIDHLGAEDTELNRAFGAKTLIGAVARVMEPGCLLKTILLIEGDQDIGKSTFCRELCHDPAWFTDTVPDIGSKDAQQHLRGIWLQEHAEMDRMNKADADRAKAFISSPVDRYRPSYGRVAQSFPRQCVFVGTINPGGTGYLRDETGAVRFWTVACGVDWKPGQSVDTAKLREARDQLWAEAVVRYQKREAWWLDATVLREAQVVATDERYADEVWGDLIREFIADRPAVTTGDILTSCLHIAPDRWTTPVMHRIGATLRKEGWRHERFNVLGGKVRAFIPAKGGRARAKAYLDAAALRTQAEANGGHPSLEALMA